MSHFLANESVHGLASPARLKIFHAYQALYDNRRSGDDNSGHAKLAGYHSSSSEEYFAENIVFRDPLLKVSGLNDYKCQFAALHSFFRNVHLEVLSVSVGSGVPGLVEPNLKTGHLNPDKLGEVLLIDANCTYEVNSFLKVTLRQFTRLGVNANGLIESHEDIWSIADVLAGLPLLGRFYRFAQGVAGRGVSMLFNGFYAYRGGVSLKQAQLSTNTLHAVYHPVQSQKQLLANTTTVVEDVNNVNTGSEKQSGSTKKKPTEQKSQAGEQKSRK